MRKPSWEVFWKQHLGRCLGDLALSQGGADPRGAAGLRIPWQTGEQQGPMPRPGASLLGASTGQHYPHLVPVSTSSDSGSRISEGKTLGQQQEALLSGPRLLAMVPPWERGRGTHSQCQHHLPVVPVPVEPLLQGPNGILWPGEETSTDPANPAWALPRVRARVRATQSQGHSVNSVYMTLFATAHLEMRKTADK